MKRPSVPIRLAPERLALPTTPVTLATCRRLPLFSVTAAELRKSRVPIPVNVTIPEMMMFPVAKSPICSVAVEIEPAGGLVRVKLLPAVYGASATVPFGATSCDEDPNWMLSLASEMREAFWPPTLPTASGVELRRDRVLPTATPSMRIIWLPGAVSAAVPTFPVNSPVTRLPACCVMVGAPRLSDVGALTE